MPSTIAATGAFVAAALLATATCLQAAAAPLARADVPDPLKPWVPWVLHGNEARLCPARHDDAGQRACVWPSRLELRASATGASFRFELQVFGSEAVVALPGEAEAWPQDVLADGRAIPIAGVEGHPAALLGAGRHVLTGTLPWSAIPQDLALPQGIGIVTLVIDGREEARAPGPDGRLWLKAAATEGGGDRQETLHVARRIEDSVPMVVTTHIDVTVAGEPRDIVIPAALLPGFVALTQNASLPVRLQADGSVVAQARPGRWAIDIGGRSTGPVQALTLPKTVAGEEVWSFLARDELRRVTIAAPAIDPKQAVMPDGWRNEPAYRMRPGETLALQQTARGVEVPNPDQLTLQREIWLDFDGGGFTFSDRIGGLVSRSSRLELTAPARLGRAAIMGADQPITRQATDGPDGIEVRAGPVQVSADSRLEGGARRFGATGWRFDADHASAILHLPPGWRLLHARGVDEAGGSWVSQWSLWDFFFVLLAALAAGRLFGARAGLVFGAALVLGWHLAGAPRVAWLVLLALTGLARALPAGKLQRWADRLRLVSAFVIAAWLLPFAVTQVRQALYPGLEAETESSSRWSLAPAAAPLPPEMEPAALKDARPMAAPAPSPESGEVAIASASIARSSVVSEQRTRLTASVGHAASRLQDIDPQAAIQTGPGVPSWRWHSHRLSWQGPVQASQSVRLVLLPPWAAGAWRLSSVALLAAALWLAMRGRWHWPSADGSAPAGSRRPGAPRSRFVSSRPVPPATALVLVLAVAFATGVAVAPTGACAADRPPLQPDDAGVSAETAGPRPTTVLDPSPELLRQLLERLTAPAACAPHCAEVARLNVAAQGSQVQLRLEVQAQADVALPLPGAGAGWHPARVSVGGLPAVLRRDESGTLWIAVPRGVSQVTLESDVGDANAVEIALPTPVRAVQAHLEGWTLGGLDARGLATGALSLARSAAPARGASAATTSAADALPPFVRVERALKLGLTWTATTTITRESESRVPLRVHVPLVAGEAVNDASVQVDRGEAVVTLGAQASTTFASTIAIAPKIALTSAAQPNQVEVWSIDVAPMWHAEFTGLAPAQADPAAAAVRAWHPWPGERVVATLSRPAGAGGQTFTADSLATDVRPGLRATEATAILQVRASQGGNRRFTLPEGAELVSTAIDGRQVTTQASAGVVTLALPPGAHTVQVAWRELRGIGPFFRTRTLTLEGDGVNAATTLSLAPDRVVLAAGGPRVGPAVLFWGVVVVLAGVAVVLARSRLAPLSAPAWFGLGLGLAPATLGGAALVVGWFFVLAARRRWGPSLSRRAFIGLQLVLVAWTLLAASVLFDALRVGLLGYPDLMIAGNGSSADSLRWYVDRFHATPASSWVLSVPVLAYRLAMLAWALWMATALLKWVRWAWDCYSEGGHWRAKNAAPAPRQEVPESAPSDPAPSRWGDSTNGSPPPYTLGGDEDDPQPA